jgi:DhnA family fructose-bisphosphate aldolase class Ia
LTIDYKRTKVAAKPVLRLRAASTRWAGETLSDCGKKIRLNRILGGDHRALVVAFDHAMVLGPIPGTEDPLGQIRRFADANVDAVLLNLGLIRQLADSSLPPSMPAIIARIDWTTVWSAVGKDGQGDLRSCLLARPEEALRHGADAVLTYMVVGTGDSDFESKEVARTAEVARECERVGIPMIVESLARGKNVTNHADAKWLSLHTRMALELGADAIKTDYTGNVASMRVVVEGCPIPILVLGGSRQASDDDALDVVRGAVMAGAAGVFFGRNVFQASDMNAFLQRARAVLEGTEVLARR